MPINAFGGGPGSGKTYGVMEHVILPAVAQGRFILTNIEGLQPDAIYEYVAANAPKGKIICIGHIRTCSRNLPEDDDFFPAEEALDIAMPVPSPDRQKVNGGDLVVIDEATRYWETGEKIKPKHRYFFREHRHFSNECGHTCDLVVIDPDLSLLHRTLKGKIELASVTRKLKELGVERYMVDLFPKCRITRKAQQSRGPYSFQKEIYSLYKSYSHEKAKEQQIDKRQNLLGGAFFKIVLPGSAIALCLGIYLAVNWFQSRTKKPEMVSSSPEKTLPAADAKPASPPKPQAPEISDKWRAVGYVIKADGTTFYLDDGERRRVFSNPTAFKVERRTYEMKVGETWVTDYSGPSSRSSSPLQR